MSHFFKTELGQSALQQRNIALTARQRRLLLLIDHDDFKDLDKDYKERIAPSELVKQLIDMGLLAEQETRSNKVEAKENDSFIQEEIVKAENTEAIHKEQTKEISEVKTPASETIELEKLPFIEIQQVMIQTLTTFCGLMARPLIQKIQSIKTVQQLKACQMQWITSLQESRIPPAQLNQTLKLINYSVQHL
ncbi:MULTISPECIES: hypothetical protein [Acinetobacter]|jgi:hypothetical protein|uniref:hypothetical protein n=1 Tax=Acinetobacter TaxID=469 RepID=UPI000C49BAB6|nr:MULTISPECIES: hypothetical protein [Acinetobacter]MBC69560.1 hypothetical protein [Acinetobacter sp.]MBT49274.1 hypothetical protein [Acinetobacter sp.]HIQ35930.1 hypothetical protein [Acinetobacter venetianus]HJP48041.1 hypothetical protein [Acinetobacter venetianus]|tara:strand:- start:2805 stop:3380 length:576 start_codon:yes stop_codon:yes gene_type:complete